MALIRSKVRDARPTNVSSYRSGSRCRSSQASVSAPLRSLSDQLVAITRTGLPATGVRSTGGWKIAGSTAFETTVGSAELEPELAMLLEAVPRLQDRRVRQLGIHRCDHAIVPSS